MGWIREKERDFGWLPKRSSRRKSEGKTKSILRNKFNIPVVDALTVLIHFFVEPWRFLSNDRFRRPRRMLQPLGVRGITSYGRPPSLLLSFEVIVRIAILGWKTYEPYVNFVKASSIPFVFGKAAAPRAYRIPLQTSNTQSFELGRGAQQFAGNICVRNMKNVAYDKIEFNVHVPLGFAKSIKRLHWVHWDIKRQKSASDSPSFPMVSSRGSGLVGSKLGISQEEDLASAVNSQWTDNDDDDDDDQRLELLRKEEDSHHSNRIGSGHTQLCHGGDNNQSSLKDKRERSQGKGSPSLACRFYHTRALNRARANDGIVAGSKGNFRHRCAGWFGVDKYAADGIGQILWENAIWCAADVWYNFDETPHRAGIDVLNAALFASIRVTQVFAVIPSHIPFHGLRDYRHFNAQRSLQGWRLATNNNQQKGKARGGRPASCVAHKPACRLLPPAKRGKLDGRGAFSLTVGFRIWLMHRRYSFATDSVYHLGREFARTVHPFLNIGRLVHTEVIAERRLGKVSITWRHLLQRRISTNSAMFKLSRGKSNAWSIDLCAARKVVERQLASTPVEHRVYQKGRLRCPVDQDWETIHIRDAFVTTPQRLTAGSWPTVLYQNLTFNPLDPWEGFLMNDLLLKVYRATCGIPGVGEGSNRADVHGSILAYVATLNLGRTHMEEAYATYILCYQSSWLSIERRSGTTNCYNGGRGCKATNGNPEARNGSWWYASKVESSPRYLKYSGSDGYPSLSTNQSIWGCRADSESTVTSASGWYKRQLVKKYPLGLT
ncbi:hypothetical protein BKA70DRAFT_1222304 [Coprinopsis sp. MPI-PUGE-AT-0042]|nr:hypothetical protein BKA70DRAFT_1222304 [Coprinopsis sp. MPI-PUGE-AT-0042]